MLSSRTPARHLSKYAPRGRWWSVRQLTVSSPESEARPIFGRGPHSRQIRRRLEALETVLPYRMPTTSISIKTNKEKERFTERDRERPLKIQRRLWTSSLYCLLSGLWSNKMSCQMKLKCSFAARRRSSFTDCRASYILIKTKAWAGVFSNWELLAVVALIRLEITLHQHTQSHTHTHAKSKAILRVSSREFR